MWEYNTDYLSHHGIKGQKWGVRRYQNEDGSYTNAGKKRRQISDKTKNYIKIGAAVVGASLAIYGTYKLDRFIKTSAMKDIVNKGNKLGDELLKEAGWNRVRAGSMGPSPMQMHNFKIYNQKALNLQAKSYDVRKEAVDKANDIGKSVIKSSKYLLNNKFKKGV